MQLVQASPVHVPDPINSGQHPDLLPPSCVVAVNISCGGLQGLVCRLTYDGMQEIQDEHKKLDNAPEPRILIVTQEVRNGLTDSLLSGALL